MSRSDDPDASRRPEPLGERPHLSTRPVTITLDVAGSQFLAVAESEHATAAIFAEDGADTAELQALFEDLHDDIPIQGRRLGVLRESAETPAQPPADHQGTDRDE